MVYLRYVEDLPYDVIARRLATTPGAARVRAHRARAQIRERLRATPATTPTTTSRRATTPVPEPEPAAAPAVATCANPPSCDTPQAAPPQQAPALTLAREALARLPTLLTELLGDDALRVERAPYPSGRRFDARIADSAGRTWLAEFKSSGSLARVAAAAADAEPGRAAKLVRLLVVPSMTAGAAEVAAARDVNWIDLAGNARIRHADLYVNVQGRANPVKAGGRPSSPFAPRRARLVRAMLLDPRRWWRQRELAERTGLDDGTVSRAVRRLVADQHLERDGGRYRPLDPPVLLAAWSDAYRFDRHDTVWARLDGPGPEATLALARGLDRAGIAHAFTGLPAAWALGEEEPFGLTSVYVDGDPRQALERLGLQRCAAGSGVQVIGPADAGVLTGAERRRGIVCVAPVQAYLDLRGLPAPAPEAARRLRARHLAWEEVAVG